MSYEARISSGGAQYNVRQNGRPEQRGMRPTLAISLVTDWKGLRLARYSIASFILSQDYRFDIHLHCDGFELSRDDPIVTFAKTQGHKLRSRKLSERRFNKFRTAAHISTTQFLKFVALEDLFGAYDRVLYVDTDFLFFEAIALPTMDFDGKPVAAVYDVAECAGVTNPEFVQNCEKNGLSKDYFNSGFMFFNSRALDVGSLKERYTELVAQHQEYCGFKTGCETNDQCVWNLMFQGTWQPAPLTWNVQASMRFTELWDRASVRHYTGPKKFLPLRPWRSDSREAKLIARIAESLGEAVDVPVNPYDLFYKTNALRWRTETQAMTNAIADLSTRAGATLTGAQKTH